MGHADDFAAAGLPDHFAVMGETWSYTPAGGEASDVDAIPGPEEVRFEGTGNGRKTIRERSLTVKTADVTLATVQNATFGNGTRTYSVARVEMVSEDVGVATVRLVHAAERDRARPGLRDGPRM